MSASMPERLSRHTFLQLDARLLARDWPGAPDRRTTEFALAWFAQQRPAICTCCDAVPISTGSVAAGIATPPAQGKRRIALKLPLSAVTAHLPPPTLRSVAERCPPHQNSLTELSRRAEAAGLRLSVFGSFAWQHITALPYVTAGSDLDVLWRARNERELLAGIQLLARWESESGLRADGEALFPNGDAVCWREWATSRDTVLVKNIDGARLATRSACLDLFSIPRQIRA